MLDEVRDTLNAAPDIKISIEGHTNSKGSNKFNKTLSQKRVDSVKKYLVEQGKIDGARLEPIGWGEEKPLTPEQQDRRWPRRQSSRRVRPQGLQEVHP